MSICVIVGEGIWLLVQRLFCKNAICCYLPRASILFFVTLLFLILFVRSNSSLNDDSSQVFKCVDVAKAVAYYTWNNKWWTVWCSLKWKLVSIKTVWIITLTIWPILSLTTLYTTSPYTLYYNAPSTFHSFIYTAIFNVIRRLPDAPSSSKWSVTVSSVNGKLECSRDG